MADLPGGSAEDGPSPYLNEDLRRDAVDVFGPNGAWLLLSHLWYGWRSWYDLAVALVEGPGPEDASLPRPSDLSVEYESVRHLQVQSFAFAATEQLLTLTWAARKHERGTSAFFDAYVAPPGEMRVMAEELADLTREELDSLIGTPQEAADVARFVPAPPSTGVPVLDLAATPVDDIGGLYLPQHLPESSAMHLMETTADIAEAILANLGEVRTQMLEAPETSLPVEVRPLRQVDNAFRHGHRVLFKDALPAARGWSQVGDNAPDPAVDLYLPDRRKNPDTERAKWAKIATGPEATASMLRSLREVSTRIGQFTRGFLLEQVVGERWGLVFAVHLELPDLP